MNSPVLLLWAAALNPAQGSVDPNVIMDRIEATLVMPPGASSLPLYGRYYAWEIRDDGVRKVLGTYVRGDRPAERHWVRQNELPLVLDGGCDIITLTYDVNADRIERLECNGAG